MRARNVVSLKQHDDFAIILAIEDRSFRRQNECAVDVAPRRTTGDSQDMNWLAWLVPDLKEFPRDHETQPKSTQK
jgi:hypothetical protein